MWTVQTVDAIFIGTHPASAFGIDNATDDAGLSYNIAGTQLITHITKLYGRLWLHIDTFLQQTQPDISTHILYDRVDFTHSEIHLTVEIRIIFQLSCLGIVDGYS